MGTGSASGPARGITPPVLRPGGGVPQYLQLASLLRHRIAHGELPAGTQLPTVVELAQQHGVARITVRQAYGVLASEGLVRSQRGRGTFVTPQDTGRTERLRSAINAPVAQDLHFRILERREEVGLPPDLQGSEAVYGSYFYLRKLHVQDGEPFCLVEIYVASEIQARFPSGAETQSKIAWLINAHAAHRMQRVRQTMTVGPCDLVLAGQLQCAFSTPIAHMTRWIFDRRERVAMAGRFWYRGDRYVSDLEFPFDMWMKYPGVVVPESRPAVQASASPLSRPAVRAAARTRADAPRDAPRRRGHLQSGA